MDEYFFLKKLFYYRIKIYLCIAIQRKGIINTQKIKIMTTLNTITKVSLEKIVNPFVCPKIDNYNGKLNVVVHYSNGGLRTFASIMREISNANLDTFQNIKKIQNSHSDKNRLAYLKQFENKLRELQII